MKSLLVGAAIGALLLPASVATAQGHDHACLDEACTVVSLFQEGAATFTGYQGIETPRYGTWGFDTAGMDPSVAPGDDFYRYANGAALDRMVIPADRSSYGIAFFKFISSSKNLSVKS
jgi:putative endopeptidase